MGDIDTVMTLSPDQWDRRDVKRYNVLTRIRNALRGRGKICWIFRAVTGNVRGRPSNYFLMSS
jgi:hypothetical protein